MTLKVLLFEDEAIVRGGIRTILESAPDIEVVAEATDGSRAVELTDQFRPDVVLTDIQMPGVDGLEVTRRLSTHAAAPAVVILTTFDVDKYVYAALRQGAVGFLLRDTPPTDLIAAVRVAARGEAMISPRITKRLLSSFMVSAAETEARTKLGTLTQREHEVAEWIGRGLSNTDIAKALFVSESTIQVHIGHIRTKLSAANRTQVAILMHDAGLV